jgi:hypothetical protein
MFLDSANIIFGKKMVRFSGGECWFSVEVMKIWIGLKLNVFVCECVHNIIFIYIIIWIRLVDILKWMDNKL